MEERPFGGYSRLQKFQNLNNKSGLNIDIFHIKPGTYEPSSTRFKDRRWSPKINLE